MDRPSTEVRRRQDARAGQGVTVGLVLLVCMVLAVMGGASLLQRSGTGRTYARVLDMRAAIEAGDAALVEAAAAIRISLDTGIATADCPDNWRRIVLDVIKDTPSGQSRTDPVAGPLVVHPVVAQANIPSADVPVTIGDVNAKILNCFVPVQAPGAATANPPQGILELSVTVRGPGGLISETRTISQRRIFYATVSQPVVPGQSFPDSAVLLYLSGAPIGTVIQ